MTNLLDSKSFGSRYASRVRIVSTPEQPTSFAGLTGIVARIVDEGNVFVRFTQFSGREYTLPFGISNLEVLR